MKTDVGLILNEEQKWILGRTLFCNWEKSDLTRTQTIRLRRQGQAGVTTIHNVLCCFFICWSLWFQCLRWFQDIKVLLSTCIIKLHCIETKSFLQDHLSLIKCFITNRLSISVNDDWWWIRDFGFYLLYHASHWSHVIQGKRDYLQLAYHLNLLYPF